MDIQELIDAARKLVADNKGLLAMDESTPTPRPRRPGVPIGR